MSEPQPIPELMPLPPAARRLLSLRTSIVLYLVLPVVVVMGLAGYAALYSVEQEVTRRLKEDVELIARAIRLPVNDALIDNRPDQVQQALDSAFRIDRIYGAYVYDENGEQIASAGFARRGIAQPVAATLAAYGAQGGGYNRTSSEAVYSYFVPLVDTGGRISGLLQVTRPASDFGEYMRWIRVAGLGLLLLLTVSLTGVVMFGHRRAIGRHFQSLVGSMTRIEGGERGHRVALSGPREMVTLQTRINAMLDGILRSEAEIARRQAEQRTLETRLRDSEKMAAIGRLAAGVAHELGSPLSAVDGTAQRLLRDRALDRRGREGLVRIRDATGRMESIVRQLMDLRRHGRSIRRRRLDQLAHSAAAELAPEFAASDVRLETGGPVPAAAVLVEPSRIVQALANILRNALQASEGGHVRLSWTAAGDNAVLTVEDDGPGVPDHLLPRLFEPFFTTKPVGQGTGLGLALAHASAGEHGGHIEVGRSPLGGAAVRLVLPWPHEEQGAHHVERR